MRVLVYGTGAIGSWLAASLCHAGHHVTCIARRSVVDAIRTVGLTVVQPDGSSHRATNVTAYTSLAEMRIQASAEGYGFDIILLCVKAYSVQSAINDLQSAGMTLNTDGAHRPLIVCFQNGVGSDEVAINVFGSDHVVAATTTTPVSILASGMVRIERSGGAICNAACGKTSNSRLHDLFRNVTPSVISYGDYRSLRWSKLLLNLMGNASGAILDMPAETIYRDNRSYRMEIAMLRETITVSRRMGIRLINMPHFPASTLAWAIQTLPQRLLQPVLRRQIVKGRGAKRPSLYYDVANATGHSEVGWLNGAVVETGNSAEIPTPVNARLYGVLSELVSHEEMRVAWRGQIARLTADL